MSATIGASLSGVTFPNRYVSLGPYISSGGNVYFFGRDSTNTGHVEPHKASDPMSAFTAQTTKLFSSANATSIEAISTYQVASVIHVISQIATGAVYYNSYTMDTDTWTLTNSEVAVAAPAANQQPVSGTTFVSLVVRSTAEPVISYNAGQTAANSTFNMVRYTRRTGTNTYSAPVNVDNGGSVNWLGNVSILGASDRVHFFLKDSTTPNFYQRTLTAANALQTFPSAFAAGTGTTDPASHSGGISGSTVKMIYRNASGSISVGTMTSADAPTNPTVTQITTSAVRQNAGNQRILKLVADGSTAHALWSDSADDLQHDSDAGSGFGTDVLEHTGTVSELSTSAYTRSGSSKLAFVMNDAGTVKYAEIALSSSQTISMDAAPLASVGRTASVLAGGASPLMDAAVLSATPRALAITPGAVSAALDAATLAAGGRNLTIVTIGDAQTILMDAASLLAQGRNLSVSAPEPQSIAMDVASLVTQGRSSSVTAGAISLLLDAAVLASQGRQITVDLPRLISVAALGEIESFTPLGVEIEAGLMTGASIRGDLPFGMEIRSFPLGTEIPED